MTFWQKLFGAKPVAVKSQPKYQLGKSSLRNLKGVDPRLVEVTKLAIELTTCDFGVHSGVRTAAEQNILYKKKASKCDGYKKKSWHQVERCEGPFGSAIDVVPYIAGVGLRWEVPLCYEVIEAHREAANRLGIQLRWGASWSELTMEETLKKQVGNYVKRKKAMQQSPFLDFPHLDLQPNYE